MTIERLNEQCKSYLPAEDLDLINRAYNYAEIAHVGQLRKSGVPYIKHPLNAAMTLAKMHLDSTTISAALLHDVIEDTSATEEDLTKKFGPEIAFLVNGVSKLGKVRIRKNFNENDQEDPDSFHSLSRQLETLQKMFVSMAKDIRVILIKLADRLHNMQTLNFVDPEKQLRIAQETIEIYAPMADRLGIGELKGQLEDLSFPYIDPKEYTELKKIVEKNYPSRLKYIKRVKAFLENELKKNHIDGEINGRAKHLFSLYNKMKRYSSIDQIYDLIALRIIVNDVKDCYAVLGIIHKFWKPLNGRIKDYIAMPKPNGYQSLHTTVFCLDGQPTEIQIRTYEMHAQAEYGIAAHWHYKTNQTKPIRNTTNDIAWVKQLADWQNRLTNPSDLADTLKLDFFQNRIFVFTPRGDVHDLPNGATPIDFAFAIHSDIGYHCSGAKVNGKMVTLNHPLQNGDIVEILTNKKSSPKNDWLNFAKTSEARSTIKQALGGRSKKIFHFFKKEK